MAGFRFSHHSQAYTTERVIEADLVQGVQALAVTALLAGPVLAHRLMPSSETQLARRTTADVVTDLLRQVPVPPAAR